MARKLTPIQVRALRIVRRMHQGRGKRGITYEGLRSFGIQSSTFDSLQDRGLVGFHFRQQGCVGNRGVFRTTIRGREVLAELELNAPTTEVTG